MTLSSPILDGSDPENLPPALPSYGSVISEVDERFDACGVLGVIVIDGTFIQMIERRHGNKARVQAFRTMAELVRRVASKRLDIEDMIVTGDMGQNEIVVLFFRDGQDSEISRREIPGFDLALRQEVQRSAKAFYPYLRTPPQVVTGSAVRIRNPRFSVESQLSGAVEEARTDAQLNDQVRRRGRRTRFIEMILDHRIYSVYEPIVEVGSHTVFGYESLARGPEDSEFKSPIALFSAAGEEDMVFQLDCLCRESGLRGAVGFPSGTKLFLNILPTAIHDPNFRSERLIKTLEDCGLTPSDVVFLTLARSRRLARRSLDLCCLTGMRTASAVLPFPASGLRCSVAAVLA
jgi:hypothetical protein